ERKRNDFSRPSVDWLIIGGGCTGATPWGNTVVMKRSTRMEASAARTTLRNVCMNDLLIGKPGRENGRGKASGSVPSSESERQDTVQIPCLRSCIDGAGARQYPPLKSSTISSSGRR